MHAQTRIKVLALSSLKSSNLYMISQLRVRSLVTYYLQNNQWRWW